MSTWRIRNAESHFYRIRGISTHVHDQAGIVQNDVPLTDADLKEWSAGIDKTIAELNAARDAIRKDCVKQDDGPADA